MLFGAKQSNIDFIVAGLGNPGTKYEKTRHNAGFMTIDAFAKKHGVTIDRSKFHALTGVGTVGDKKVLFIKPQTYMNESGVAVHEAMAFYKVPSQNVLLMFDDISLEPGRMRVRRKGSDGGQKGCRSIIQLCGTDEFPRIKMGIGAKPHPDYELADWVLSTVPANEMKKLEEAIENACEAAELIIAGKTDEAMNRFN